MIRRIVYVSMVGYQPAAVAVAVKTLCKHGLQPAEIVLLHTDGNKGTAGQAERLERFFDNHARKTWWQQDGIVTKYRYRKNDIAIIASALQKQVEDQQTSRVYYDCSAGLNFQQAALAVEVGRLDKLVVLYSEYENLVQVGGNDKWKLADLGCHSVLSLHGLKYKKDKGKIVIQRDKKNILTLDTIFERQGRLYGEVVNPIPDINKARKFIASLRNIHGLNSLRIRVLARTDREVVFRRLRADQMDVVAIGEKWLIPKNTEIIPGVRKNACKIIKAWKDKNPPEPGRIAAGPDEENARPPKKVDGCGGSAPLLLVCLGNDPSSTLTALYSHRPRIGVIFFDNSNKFITGLARRIANEAGAIPVGMLKFQPASLTGCGVCRDNVSEFQGNNETIYANITPGTKAQAWMLGRMQHPVKPCSLDTRSGKIRHIDNGNEIEKINAPPTLVQAKICGGPFKNTPIHIEQADRHWPFLQKLVNWTSRLAELDAQGKFLLQQGGSWEHSGDHLKCELDDKEKLLRITIREKGREFQHTVKNNDSGDGSWLEVVTAAAFAEAGLQDVQVGLKWSWIDRNREGHRTELDVLGRLGVNFVAISVKSSLPSGVGVAKAEIIAEAHSRMGRFCLPVLVRPIGKGGRPQLEKNQKQHKRQRLLEIGIYQLGSFKKLKEIVNQAFQNKHTT